MISIRTSICQVLEWILLFALLGQKTRAFTTTSLCYRPYSPRQQEQQQPRTCFYASASTSSSVSSNEDLLPGIAAIDAANPELLAKLESLRDKPYFRFYSIDILASCEYMPQELYECYTETCEIYPEDENQVRVFFS